MPFAATTRDRVMGCLELSLSAEYTQAVDTALATAQAQGGEVAVTRVEGYLSKYETQETALNADAAGAGLIKADVLEWAEGGKTKGFQEEMQRLQRLVARSLGIEHLMVGGGSRRVRLIR